MWKWKTVCQASAPHELIRLTPSAPSAGTPAGRAAARPAIVAARSTGSISSRFAAWRRGTTSAWPSGRRVEVHERDRQLVLVDPLGGQLARDDLAEDAVGIGVGHRAPAYRRAGRRPAPRAARVRARAPPRARRSRPRRRRPAVRRGARPARPGLDAERRRQLVAAQGGRGGSASNASAAGSPRRRAADAPRSPARRCRPRVARRSAALSTRDVDRDRRAGDQVVVQLAPGQRRCAHEEAEPQV